MGGLVVLVGPEEEAAVEDAELGHGAGQGVEVLEDARGELLELERQGPDGVEPRLGPLVRVPLRQEELGVRVGLDHLAEHEEGHLHDDLRRRGGANVGQQAGLEGYHAQGAGLSEDVHRNQRTTCRTRRVRLHPAIRCVSQCLCLLCDGRRKPSPSIANKSGPTHMAQMCHLRWPAGPRSCSGHGRRRWRRPRPCGRA